MSIPRRNFLAGTAAVTLVGLAETTLQAQPAQAKAAAARPIGDWPRMGMNTQNTCYQPLAGKISSPVVAARTFLGGTTSWVMAADLDGDGTKDLLYITGGHVLATGADLSTRWTAMGLGPTDILGVYDLAGDGRRQVVVLGLTTVYALSAVDGSIVWQHDFGTSGYVYSKSIQIGRIDAGRSGLQMVVWPYYSEYGFAFAFEGGVSAGTQIWQSSPAYENPAYLPELMIGDVNSDGKTEVVIAGYHEISAFAGATGVLLDGSGGAWNGRVNWETGPGIDGRNYGQIQLVNLDSDTELEVVDLSDSVTLHAAVLQNSASGMSLLWDKFIEYTENHKALRTTVNSVGDVDGDGRTEIVCSLFNDGGDNRWHLLVADALGGLDTPKLDLPDRYIRGVQDFDGDGKAELLVTVETSQTPGTSSTLELYAVGAGGGYELVWSTASAQLVTDPHSDYPTSLSPGSRNGRLEVLRADPLSSFLVISGNTLRGYTFGDGAVTQTWSRAYDGGVIHRVQDLNGDGVAEVLYQTADGFLRLEKPDGTLVSQAPLAGLSGIATVANIDGKRRNAIIVPGFGAVRVFDYSDGRLIQRWRQRGQGEYVYRETLESVPAADLNGDGRSELVFVEAVDGHTSMRVVDGTGGEVWKHVFTDLPAPTLAGPNGAYLWTFGDFSGHDGLDVYVGANRSGYNTEVSRVLNGRNGALLAARDDGPGHVGAQFGPWTGAPAVFDLDGDGIDNVVFLAADVTYDLNGTNTADVKILDGHLGLYHTPVIADVDGDGRPEVLMTAGFNYLDVIDIDSSGAGSTLWRVETAPGELFGRRSAVVDVDGDGVVELATLSDAGNLTCRNAATGAVKWTFALPGRGLAANVIAVDIDGDGHIEYVVGTEDGTVYAIDGRTNAPKRVKWSLSIGSRLGDIIAADVDGDGRSELLVTAEDGYLYVIDSK